MRDPHLQGSVSKPIGQHHSSSKHRTYSGNQASTNHIEGKTIVIGSSFDILGQPGYENGIDIRGAQTSTLLQHNSCASRDVEARLPDRPCAATAWCHHLP